MSITPLKKILSPLSQYACSRGISAMSRLLPMESLRTAAVPVLIERGEMSDTLVIAFTGGANWINIPLFEFFETTQILKYSRILLKDQYQMFYHHGIDWRRRDWPALIRFLNKQVRRLGPKRVFCIGSSAGGYAALIAGHYLKADFVHAFGPQTVIRLDPQGIREGKLPSHRRRLAVSKRVFREVLDLVPLLTNGNGKTQMFVHYCNGHSQDRSFAERVAELPRVTTFGYPCDVHEVAISLAKQRFLGELLQVANQENLAELARDHFGMKIKITRAAAPASSDSAAVSPDVSRLTLSLR